MVQSSTVTIRRHIILSLKIKTHYCSLSILSTELCQLVESVGSRLLHRMHSAELGERYRHMLLPERCPVAYKEEIA